jgi:hypothetical protein
MKTRKLSGRNYRVLNPVYCPKWGKDTVFIEIKALHDCIKDGVILANTISKAIDYCDTGAVSIKELRKILMKAKLRTWIKKEK